MTADKAAIVDRWFSEYWGNLNPAIVDELAAENVVVRYPLGEASRGRRAVRDRIVGFAELFPDGGFALTDELIVEGDRVVAVWEGGGTHTGPAWELPVGVLPEGSGERMQYTGITVFRVRDGLIVEEYGESDYLRAMQQLGLVDRRTE